MQINNWQWQDFELVNSTNDIAIKNSPIFKKQHFIISAKMQTNARGRLKRTWQSLEGNLFASLGFPLNKFPLNILPFLLSLSLLETIKELNPDINIILKWPNDVMINGKKVSGILLETADNHIIAGIGVNIKNSPQNKLTSYPATNLKACDINIDKYDFLQLYIKQLDNIIQIFQQSGFQKIRKEWLENTFNIGTPIIANLPKRTLEGIFVGIDTDGALLLQQTDQITKIYAGDIFYEFDKDNNSNE